VNDAEDPYMLVNDQTHEANTTDQVTKNMMTFQSVLNKAGYAYVVHYLNPKFTMHHTIYHRIGAQNVWMADYNLAEGATPIHTDNAAWQWGQAGFTVDGLVKEIDANLDYIGRFTKQNVEPKTDGYFKFNSGTLFLEKEAVAYENPDLTGNVVKTYPANTFLPVSTIAYEKDGTPYFILLDGSYISASSANAIQVPAGYITEMPTVLTTANAIQSYSNPNFTGNAVRKFKKNTTIQIAGTIELANGLPVLKIGENEYITAAESAYKSID
jgi:hypothetical protein